MYLIIDGEYSIYKSEVLSGKIRSQAKQGNLSVVDIKSMRVLNKTQFDKNGYVIGEEWSDIQG